MSYCESESLCQSNSTLLSTEFEADLDYNASLELLTQNLKLDIVKKFMRDKLFYQLIVYVVLFIVGAVSNVFVFVRLFAKSNRRSRMNFLLRHLTFADLLVVFVTIPMEITWRITITWNTGELSCKVLQMLRYFGINLSSSMIICISVDRFYAIVHPMSYSSLKTRNQILLAIAYLTTFLLSMPQAFVFHIEHHPDLKQFTQCVQLNFFDAHWKHATYVVLTLCGLYFVPLIISTTCYLRIVCSIRNNRNVSQRVTNSQIHGMGGVNRSSLMSRATRRALRMTAILTAAFVVCWTPYALLILWYQIDMDSAQRVINSDLKEYLLIFAVSSSVVNPFVHSTHLFTQYFKRARRESESHTRTNSRTRTAEMLVPQIEDITEL